jgi:hypothetical protein
MLTYTNAEIVETLRAAKNINAAVKKFLKAEGDANPRAARFAKSLRDAFASRSPVFGEKFIETYRADYEIEILALTKYAFADQIVAISSQVIEKYADVFNETYAVDGDKFSFTDEKKFKEIVLEVLAIVDGSLKALSIPQSAFTKNTLIYSIFDPIVAKEVVKIAKATQK